MNEEMKQQLINQALKSIDDPWNNLTLKDIAKDLKMNENTANKIFKRKDFPSINLGKTKTVTCIAYMLWKIERKEELK